MNLIYDAWIPVRRKSGKKEKIAPWQVTKDMACDPVIELASVRPDFNGALIHFLIGLLQTTCAPNSNKEWRAWRDDPPTPEELKRKFEEVAFAFFLSDDPRQKWDKETSSPRFMQDLTLEKEKKKTEETIEKLFLDSPGEQTLKFNTDHFIKRGRIEKLCFSCSAQALLTLQINAPSGGKGHRVGLRRGGPVTTIIQQNDLWQTIWSNVLDQDKFNGLANKNKLGGEDKFPWCCDTRTSDHDSATTARDIHPAQIYWSIPRRIRILFDNGGRDNCDLCSNSDIVVTRYLTKPYGVMYKNILHPLTPVYSNAQNELLPMYQHKDIGYKYWLGYAQTIPDGKRKVAEIINQIIGRGFNSFSLWAFGYHMDKMKASCWYEGMMPVVTIEDQDKREIYEAEIASIIKAADSVADSLRYAVKDAWFDPKLKKSIRLGFVVQRFWQETEADFYQKIGKLREDIIAGSDGTSVKQEWHKCIVRKGEQIFDEISQAAMIDEVNVKRVAQARNKLMENLRSKNMKQNILGLPQS